MKERPIPFSGPMVRAILEGRKTQTRRVVKDSVIRRYNALQPLHKGWDEFCSAWSEYALCADADLAPDALNLKRALWRLCPYGQPGDRLWVREMWQPFLSVGDDPKDCDYTTGRNLTVHYPATEGRIEHCNADGRCTDACKPSIHMPRWASRITLELTDVRVERVQEITDEDVLAEGVVLPSGKQPYPVHNPARHFDVDFENAFRDLWDSINAKRGFGWEANPWVWVLAFKEVPR